MKHFFLFFVLFVSLSFVSTTFAAGPDVGTCLPGQKLDAATGACVTAFTPLVGIPYIDTSSTNLSLPGYVNALYTAAISIAAFMAVVKIIFAGVKYMLSDVVTTKEESKKDIRGALIGLLIVVGAVLILNTINPNLTGLKALNGPALDINLEFTDTVQDKIDKKCAEFGENNCKITSCSIFTNSDKVLGWLGSWVGSVTEVVMAEIGNLADEGATDALCSVTCSIKSGTVIGKKCIYPEDTGVVALTAVNTSAAALKEIIPNYTSRFTFRSMASTTEFEISKQNNNFLVSSTPENTLEIYIPNQVNGTPINPLIIIRATLVPECTDKGGTIISSSRNGGVFVYCTIPN